MSMDNFIELHRRFAPYIREKSTEHDDLGGFETGFWVTYDWSEVLKNRGAVILAEAGAGKSFEFRNQTHRLQEEGKFAFYCPLENLAGLPLQEALQIGTPDELASWIQGDEEAWFFLDAVDEAKLRNPRQFERAIAKYAAVVGECRFRTHTIISTRPNAWNTISDRETLFRCLGLKAPGPPG